MKTVGIDLGTTNTLVLVGDPDGPRRDPSDDLIPSVVAYLPNGTTSVGSAARQRRAIDAKNTVFSAKRIIGRGWFSAEVKRFRQTYPFELVPTPTGKVAFRTRVGDVSPTQVAAQVLVGACARQGIRPEECRAIVAVPAEFGPEQCAATVEAGKLAGFQQVSVVDEPVATGLAYATRGLEGVRKAVVYDLGGGTFDVAVLDCTTEPFRVLAHGGDAYLGGDDVDRALAAWVAREALARFHWDPSADPEVHDRLIFEVEKVKTRLSFAPETGLLLAQVDPGLPFATREIMVRRDALEQASYPLVQRTFHICDDVLFRAGIRRDAIDAVYLAGGSTNLPAVRRDVARYFDREPISTFDPMAVVAIGASTLR